MRNALLLLLVALSTTAHAAKTTVDPNKAAAARPQAVAVDIRLQKKVTYTSGNVRLHTIVEDLTKKTGVAIYAGSGPKDWKVRDVPVCVNVKDTPLGDLLSTLALCVHARLGSERMGDDPKALKSYRIFRRNGEEITPPPASKTADAQIEWAWDSLASVKSASPEVRSKVNRESLLLSEIVASLGPEAKAKLLARETLLVDIKDSPQHTWLAELYDIGLSKANAYAREHKEPLPDIPQDPDNGLLRIAVRGDGSNGFLALLADITPGGWATNLLNAAENLRFTTDSKGNVAFLTDLKLPPRPSTDPATSLYADIDVPAGWERMDNDCKADILDKQISLEWKSKTVEPTYADLIAAVSEKTGLNIIREDFTSHRRNQEPVRDKFSAKTTLRKALLGGFNPGWILNRNTNTIIFWEWNWRTQHVNLVPESVVTKLRAKLNGDGVEFEDILPLLALDNKQFTEWIVFDKELGKLGNLGAFSAKGVYWSFIGQLPYEEQTMAMSDQGLKIGTLQLDWVAEYITKATQQALRSWTPVSAFAERKLREESMRDIQPMTDPAIAKTAILRIKSKPATVVLPGDESKHTYYIELDFTKDGKRETQTFSELYPPFPVFSDEIQAKRNKVRTQK